MLIEVSVVPEWSYFSRPQRDFSLLPVNPEMIVIQMFICSLLQEMENRLGGLHHTVVVQTFSVFLLLSKQE